MGSNTNSHISICKLNVKGQKIYVRIFWENSEDCLFFIKLYDGSNSWSGKCSSGFASLIEEPEEEYNSNVMEGLTGVRDDFIFDFVCIPGESKAKFSWKKVFSDLTEMPYGSVDLDLDDETETKDSLIDFLLTENKELRDLIETFEKKNLSLLNRVEQSRCELEEFVNMKSSLETTLYGKFVQLLNEKKERIRLLEDSIQKYD